MEDGVNYCFVERGRAELETVAVNAKILYLKKFKMYQEELRDGKCKHTLQTICSVLTLVTILAPGRSLFFLSPLTWKT